MNDLLQLPLSKAELSLADRVFYMHVWRSRSSHCECCPAPLYEPRLYMFHHILEKRQKKFSYEDFTMFRHCLWNIMLLCWECHDAYERNPDTRPFIVNAKRQLLDIIAHGYQYDKHDIWKQGELISVYPIHQLFGNYPIQFE